MTRKIDHEAYKRSLKNGMTILSGGFVALAMLMSANPAAKESIKEALDKQQSTGKAQ